MTAVEAASDIATAVHPGPANLTAAGRTTVPLLSKQSTRMPSNLPTRNPHCDRMTEARQIIQDVLLELKDRAETNVMIREPLACLEEMQEKATRAEVTCSSVNSLWVEHEYTYTERITATEFTVRLQKLISLALSFSTKTLLHDPTRAIKLVRLRHDAAMVSQASR